METSASGVIPARSPAREATRADLEDIPETQVGEIIEGRLYVSPRPRPRHARSSVAIASSLWSPYDRGIGGPGGWWILPEPGIELPDAQEIVPDVAGWRRERLPDLPDEPISVVPDWVCEVLSPSTRTLDIRKKRPFYAQVGVRHMWVVDGDAQTLTVSRLVEGHWLEVGSYGIEDRVRAEPFEAVEMVLADWWPPRK